MKITIPLMSTTASIKVAFPVPRSATHFRFTSPSKKPIIDKLANLDTLAGCSGKLEFGKPEFQGRGKHAKIIGFETLAVASQPHVPGTRKPVPAQEATPETAQENSAGEGEVAAPEPPAKGKKTQLAVPTRADAQPSSKGRKRALFGHSACAVAKALGKAGIKWAEADAVFRTNGIEMPKASLSVQLGFGRNEATWERHGNPAPLTDAQIAELRSGATVAP